MKRLLPALAAVLLACSSAHPPPPTTATAPAPASAVAPPAGAAAAARPGWASKLELGHPLVGKLWDVRAGAFVEPARLFERALGARFVLLGEKHDNADHHRLQAQVLEQLVHRGRRPAVVLEMLELEQQPAIDEYVKASGATGAAGFGGALGWEKTSWPPFPSYQPIFEVAWTAKLPLVAGNLAHATARALVKQGLSALPPERAQQLRLEKPFPAGPEASLLTELRASHCGHLPEPMLAPMALAQHARDAQMARALLETAPQQGAVLIAGGGHARLDRGVPYYLALEAPAPAVLSVVFLEVQRAESDPRAYAATFSVPALPFDYVWFTPRDNDDDPCAAFAK